MPNTEADFFDEAWGEANANPKEEKQEGSDVQPQSQEESKAAERPEDKSHLANADGAEASTKTETIDYKALYEKEAQRTKSWEGRIRAANAKAEEALGEVARLRQENQELRKAAEGRQQASPQGGQVETDDETLKSFLQEFPDLHAPLQALIRKEAKALVTDEMKSIKPTMQKLEQSEAQRQKDAATKANEAHFDAIREKHPDFQQLVIDGKLDEWISSKPTILQDSLWQVKEKGTAAEVIEMFDTMKADQGIKPSPKSTNEPTGDKQEKLKSMVAVPGSTGGPPPNAPDRNDFDSAWDEANKK